MTERTADKLTDPLHARCLVLDDGTTQIDIIIVDSCTGNLSGETLAAKAPARKTFFLAA